ncbi:MAG: hypothetical protein MJ196_10825 [Treponemataceae bacterium]|nr:hypothetical protein [Treponemataceae bacterium]
MWLEIMPKKNCGANMRFERKVEKTAREYIIRDKAEKNRANMRLEIKPRKIACEYAVGDNAEEKLRANICLVIMPKKKFANMRLEKKAEENCAQICG